MHSLNSDLEYFQAAAPLIVAIHKAMGCQQHGFHLNRAFGGTNGLYRFRRHRSQARNIELILLMRIASHLLGARNRIDPVNLARRSTASTCRDDGRLRTNSRILIKFSVVFELASNPSMHRQPSQNADDIGARFMLPSSLAVLIRTTGVPK